MLIKRKKWSNPARLWRNARTHSDKNEAKMIMQYMSLVLEPDLMLS